MCVNSTVPDEFGSNLKCPFFVVSGQRIAEDLPHLISSPCEECRVLEPEHQKKDGLHLKLEEL